MDKNERAFTQADFVTWAEQRIIEVLGVLQRKGQQYSKDTAFSNFIEGAKLHGISPQHYLMILATKHWHNLCKDPESDTAERTGDIIVYMLLLDAMNKKGLK